MQKIDFTEKRIKERLQIRRKEANQKSKRRMQDNITRLSQFSERDSFEQEIKLQKIFQALEQHDRPQKPYNLEQIPAVFNHLEPLILKPCKEPIAFWILESLQQLLIFKLQLCSEKIIRYAIRFIEENKYDHLTEYTEFQKYLLIFLYQLTLIDQKTQMRQQQSQLIIQLKRLLLKWCRGQHSLDIISNCITNFPNIKEFKHIYEIIEYGIGSQKQELSKSSTIALSTLLQQASVDNIFDIHEYYPGIYCKLLFKAQNFKDPSNFLYITTIQKLLNTFSGVVVGLTSIGLVELLQKLFSNSDNKIYLGGLMILNDLVYCNDEKMGQYLTSPYLCAMWNKISSLHSSSMSQQALLVYSIFSGFFSSFGQDAIQNLLSEIQEGNSIFRVIQSAFTIHKNMFQVSLHTVQIIKSILCYMGKERLGQIFLKELIRLDLVKYIQFCAMQYYGQLSTMASQILQIVKREGINNQ